MVVTVFEAIASHKADALLMVNDLVAPTASPATSIGKPI
jgi:hypothetical protein